jgi:hypothetical protein
MAPVLKPLGKGMVDNLAHEFLFWSPIGSRRVSVDAQFRPQKFRPLLPRPKVILLL